VNFYELELAALTVGFPVSHVFLVSRNTKLNEIHHQFREILHVSRINILCEILFRFVTSKILFCFVKFHLVSFFFATFHLVLFRFAKFNLASFRFAYIHPALTAPGPRMVLNMVRN
jgi:hypothetical protein